MSLRTLWLRGRRWKPGHQFARFNSTIYHDTLIPFFNGLANTSRLLEDFHTAYPRLAKQLKDLPTEQPLSGQTAIECDREVSYILEALAASGGRGDMERINEILTDMPKVFLLQPTLDHHSIVLRALIRAGKPNTVERWLMAMESKPPYLPPSLQQYHEFLVAFTDKVPLKFLKRAVRVMSRSGCKPTNETFRILINSVWKMSSHLNDGLWSIIGAIKLASLPYDPSIPKLIREGLAARGFAAQAEPLITKYNSLTSFQPSPEQELEIEWVSRIAEASKQGGFTAALGVYEEFCESGGILSPPIAEALLRYSKSLSDLEHLEKELHFTPSSAHWAILVANSCKANKLADATAIYGEARRRGFTPDGPLVGPLIKRLAVVNDSYLDQALDIYRAYLEASRTFETSLGPDADMYRYLFDGLAAAHSQRKYDRVVENLLHDMDERGIPIKLVAPQRIIISMKRAPDENAAYAAYRTLSHELSQSGYFRVLEAFIQLKFSDTFIPSVNLYFDIVSDMRARSLTITRTVYTIILQEIEKLTTLGIQSRSAAFLDQLTRATRRTHDFLVIEASISPDAALWNQLMETYYRQGHFADTCRVWDEMYLSNRFDHDSVTIILNACGRHDEERLADQIHGRLAQDGYRFSKGNWDTWIRCLCRFGRLNDATKAVCLEMGRQGVEADAYTVKILLAFAKKAQGDVLVLTRIRRYLPELWERLPHELQR